MASGPALDRCLNLGPDHPMGLHGSPSKPQMNSNSADHDPNQRPRRRPSPWGSTNRLTRLVSPPKPCDETRGVFFVSGARANVLTMGTRGGESNPACHDRGPVLVGMDPESTVTLVRPVCPTASRRILSPYPDGTRLHVGSGGLVRIAEQRPRVSADRPRGREPAPNVPPWHACGLPSGRLDPLASGDWDIEDQGIV